MRTSLSRLQAREPTSAGKIRAMAVDAWRQGILVIRVEDVANAFDRQALENIGNALYGPRGKG